MARARTLYLMKDPEVIREQVAGRDLESGEVRPDELVDGVSTDAIIPAVHCIGSAEPERLGRFCLAGLGNRALGEGDLRRGGFETLVVGRSFGRGSSREQAQLALRGAGIKRLAVRSAERIFSENCLNHGLPIFPLEDERVRRALAEGRVPPEEAYLEQLPPISRAVAAAGGLVPFSREYLAGEIAVPEAESAGPQAMTMVEKIAAAHAGVRSVRPGQQMLVGIDRAYTYELQTVVASALLEGLGPEDVRRPPEVEVFVFEDHLALFGGPAAEGLRQLQRAFAKRFRLPSYELAPKRGVEGICHTVMLERHSRPGELILGNDSHTCTLGATGALAVGKGASETAAALLSGRIVLAVPESIRFELQGELQPGVTSKDLVLWLLSRPAMREDLLGSGRAFEFGGPGLEALSFDEQVVLANMAIEGQAFTGIVEPNRRTFDSLRGRHGDVRAMAVYPDTGAEYAAVLGVHLPRIEPMVSLPGDTQRAIPLSELGERVKVDIAYLGSCTGGKLGDLEMAARALRGRRIAPGVRLFVQGSSQAIRAEAERRGLLDVFRAAGAEVLPPGCGACMAAGPGTSREGETTISDTNRNFYGRMGKGDAYLASPAVVAASAVAGYISGPTA